MMNRKGWHKPLHMRKIWREMSWYMRTKYYMKPFVRHLQELWWRPLPCPTIIKLCISMVLITLICLPLIFYSSVILLYYMIVQIYLQRIFDFEYPQHLNLIQYWNHIFNEPARDQNFSFIPSMYIEHWCHVVTAITSLIDYTRLFVCIMTN